MELVRKACQCDTCIDQYHFHLLVSLQLCIQQLRKAQSDSRGGVKISSLRVKVRYYFLVTGCQKLGRPWQIHVSPEVVQQCGEHCILSPRMAYVEYSLWSD